MQNLYFPNIAGAIFVLLLTSKVCLAQPSFTPYANNPVLGYGPPGSWDSGVLYLPEIVFKDSLYYMFYSGSTNLGIVPFSIGYATSPDGYTWTKYGANPVFQADGTGFDAYQVGEGRVILRDSLWFLYYGARSVPGPGPAPAIGLVLASDPSGPWQEGWPGPVLEVGSSGEWDAGFVTPNAVIATASGYVMYYSGGSNFLSTEPRLIGMATSPDGVTWTKYNDPNTTDPPYAESDPVLPLGPPGSYDSGLAWECDVLQTANGWEMFYTSVPDNWSVAHISYATSSDGIQWVKDSVNNPILEATQSWALDVQTPSAITIDGTHFLYYNGYTTLTNGQIGLATEIRANTWTPKQDMPTARYILSTSAVNGKIYAIGGKGVQGDSALSTVEEYNPATNTWDTTLTPMPTARQQLSSSVVDGRIYVIGGVARVGAPALATVEAYDPATDTWDTTLTSMPTARFEHSTSAVNGKIYAIGGYIRNGTSGRTAVVEAYDPATDTWDTTLTLMPTARFALSTTVVDGRIYAIGGALTPGGSGLSTVEMYDPVTDSWVDTLELMPTPRATFLSTSAVNRIIYVIGGMTGQTPLATVEAYNPVTNTWVDTLTPMPTARGFLATSAVNGKIYAIGGGRQIVGPWLTAVSDVEEYTPPTWLTSVEDPSGEQRNPTEFVLYQNYPNPFNPSSTIEFSLPRSCHVRLQIFSILGELMATLVEEELNVGTYTTQWNAWGVASGVYFYRLQSGDFIETKKLILLR